MSPDAMFCGKRIIRRWISGDRVQFTEDGGMRRFQPSFFVPRKNFTPMEYFVSVRQKLSFPVKTEPAADQERGNEICL